MERFQHMKSITSTISTKRLVYRCGLAVTTLVLAVACGAVDDTLPGATSTEGSDDGTTDSTLETTILERNEEVFVSVAEIGRASTDVVVGMVSHTGSIGTPDVAEDPHASEFIAVTVDVEEALKGQPDKQVVFAWEAYLTDGGGKRTMEILAEGLPIPKVGDRLLLFLVPEDKERVELFGAELTHRPITLDGLAYIDGSTVELVADKFEGDLGDSLLGLALPAIRAEVSR